MGNTEQAQQGLHELYYAVADINAQEEGLPPPARPGVAAPSSKPPAKRAREDCTPAPASAPAPAPAAVPVPAVSPAVQAPLQPPAPTPELRIEDDSACPTQFVPSPSSFHPFFLLLIQGWCVHGCVGAAREKHAAAGFSTEPLARRAMYETYACLCFVR